MFLGFLAPMRKLLILTFVTAHAHTLFHSILLAHQKSFIRNWISFYHIVSCIPSATRFFPFSLCSSFSLHSLHSHRLDFVCNGICHGASSISDRSHHLFNARNEQDREQLKQTDVCVQSFDKPTLFILTLPTTITMRKVTLLRQRSGWEG